MSSSGELYDLAVRQYRPWKLPSLLSKRLRMMIRMIALEERCQEYGAGAIPPQVMMTMRLLSDYREKGQKRYYRKAAGRMFRMDCTIPFEELSCMCGHRAIDPMLVQLPNVEVETRHVLEDIVCSQGCVGERKLLHQLVYVPESSVKAEVY